jgi:hypothetical protein
MKKKFRIPRKIKKKVKKKILLYPSNSRGSSVMAFPYKSQKDYNAYKNGELKSLLSKQKEKKIDIDVPIEVSNDRLKEMVGEVFAEEYRTSAYLQLLNYKTSVLNKKKKYYNFINYYNKDNFNSCCMILD